MEEKMQEISAIEKIAIFQQRKNYFGNYDALKGVSGTLYNLLAEKETDTGREKIELMLKFLVALTQNYSYWGKQLPRYHIRRNYQYNFYERMQMPHGHINMGVAHGVIGPAVAMSKALSLGIEVSGQREAIMTICSWYDQFSKRESGVLQFPRRLRIEDYLKGIGSDYTINSGWCYGNLGVIRSRMKIANYLNQAEEYERFKEEFIKVVDQPLENYNLKAPILCHGYASVVSMQIYAYKESDDENCLRNIDRNAQKLMEMHNEWKETDEIYREDDSILSGSRGVELTLENYRTHNCDYGKLLMMD